MSNREEFASRYRQEVQPVNGQKSRQGRYLPVQREQRMAQRRENGRQPVKYTATRGTAHQARKRKKRPNTRLAALILAAAIGVGGISLINHGSDKGEPVNIIEMQEDGINPQSLGLSAETIEQFEKYDEYFANFDEKDGRNLTDEQVISMINEIEEMHFSTVKEKMGDLVGADPKNIKMYYGFDQSDGNTHTSIIINEGTSQKEAYSNDKVWPFPTKNNIPSELADVIQQLDDLSDLETDIKTDKITKINAIKELRKLYESLEQVATGEFVKDEKGNISIIHYEKEEQTKQEEAERD